MVLNPHLITWTTGVETIKRQTRAAYGCLIAGQGPGHGLSMRPMGCTPAQSVTQNRRCSFGMRLVVLLYHTLAW